MAFNLGIETRTLTIIGRCAERGHLGVAITTSTPAVGARCPLVRSNLAAVASQAHARHLLLFH